ncbi:MAG: T9SS type A sorting domain-containing protein [candidate division Zixibacteria bacterium]|nr:T9SS type A sorting domain-containing protein [candidate division Zixibacteria bacterium]
MCNNKKIGSAVLFFSLFFFSVTLGKGPTHPSVNTFGMGGPYLTPTWPYYNSTSMAWMNTHIDFQYWGSVTATDPTYALYYNRGQAIGEYYNTWCDNENSERHLDLVAWMTAKGSTHPESCLVHWRTNAWEHPTSVAEWFFVPGWDNANDADHNWTRDKESDFDYNNAVYGTRFTVQRTSSPYYIEDAGGGLSGVSWTANKWRRDYIKLGWGGNPDTVSYRVDSSTTSRLYLPSAPPSHTYTFYFVDDSSAVNHNAVAMADTQARVIQCFWTSDLRQIIFNMAKPLVQSWNGHSARKLFLDEGSYRPRSIHSDNPFTDFGGVFNYLEWTYGGTSPTCFNEPEIDTGWGVGNMLSHKAIRDTFAAHPNDSMFLMVSFAGNYCDTSLVQYGSGGMEENMIEDDGKFEANDYPPIYWSHHHQIRWYQQHNKYVLIHAQGYPGGEQSKIYSLATYYLYKTDSVYYLYGTGSAYGVNFGDTTVWWYGLMSIDMGTPTDTCKIVQSPGGSLGNLWKRPFTKGIALARHRCDGCDDYTSSSSYSLGGYYYRLNSTGAIVGDSINSISLRNNEGAVLTKRVPGTALLPPTPLSPQNGSTVDTTQPTLIIHNVQDSAGRPVLYYFELDTTTQFGSQKKKESTPFELGAGQDSTTHWTVPTPLSSGVYYWRSRAYTNTYPSDTSQPTAVYHFQLSTGIGDSIYALFLPSPVGDEQVVTLRPTLNAQFIHNGFDRNQIRAKFLVGEDPAFDNDRTIFSPYINIPDNLTLSWTLDRDLQEGRRYFWRVNVYDLDVLVAASDPGSFLTGSIHVFPNPFKPSKGDNFVTFRNIPLYSKIQITTLSGELVRELTGNASTDVVWDVKSKEGKDLASGVYYYRVDFQSGSSTGKLAVIR